MKYTPDDASFNRTVNAEIEGSQPDERVIFIDNDNKVREVVYASMFDAGELKRVRAVLEKSGVLKGVVHVSAAVLGDRNGHGPRYSTVEYLPEKQFYVRQHVIRSSVWVTKSELIETAIEATQSIFEREEEEPEGK